VHRLKTCLKPVWLYYILFDLYIVEHNKDGLVGSSLRRQHHGIPVLDKGRNHRKPSK